MSTILSLTILSLNVTWLTCEVNHSLNKCDGSWDSYMQWTELPMDSNHSPHECVGTQTILSINVMDHGIHIWSEPFSPWMCMERTILSMNVLGLICRVKCEFAHFISLSISKKKLLTKKSKKFCGKNKFDNETQLVMWRLSPLDNVH